MKREANKNRMEVEKNSYVHGIMRQGWEKADTR
jgi:hypothetical protein